MRPLIRRAPDGRRYAVPRTPRYPAPEPPRQAVNGTSERTESHTPASPRATGEARRRRRAGGTGVARGGQVRRDGLGPHFRR